MMGLEAPAISGATNPSSERVEAPSPDRQARRRLVRGGTRSECSACCLLVPPQQIRHAEEHRKQERGHRTRSEDEPAMRVRDAGIGLH